MEQQHGASSCTRRGAPTCAAAVPHEPPMNVLVRSTTGTSFDLCVAREETVDGLKRRLAQRLRVPKERLVLLFRETRLGSGKLQDFGVVDGSKLTLVPTVEAGLMSQPSRPEQSVIQALESLTETQVSDFLSGRSPLTLALRVGDHMMFVQLQLAAQQAGGSQQQQQGEGAPGPGSSPKAPQSPHSHPSATPHQAPSSHRGSHVHSQRPSGLQSPSPPASCPQAFCRPGSPARSATPAARFRRPGAVIESFVSHAPGVFSGTFSGTLHPSCQDSSGRPRRDISTVLQILNDLLSATRHCQGAPPPLSQLRRQAASSPPPPPATPAATAGSPHPLVQSQIRVCDPPAGDGLRQTENRATRCKVQRLQLLMQQRRLRRKARRDSRGPYGWAAGRKAGRSDSNSSLSSDGSLDLDFDDSVWKPGVKADLNSEFVVA
ncbi:midnolin-like [Scleropages formosus]|nr:midnolin-like [Scleropages formosus]XP_029105103.1 midnolin-like [Scleropages formosus]